MAFELSILRWIQSFATPFLDRFFEMITMLGEQWAVVLILAAVYWLSNKKMGQELAFTLLVSGLANNILKGIFRFERPIGQEGIRTLREHTATGYSFPSGHAQNAATLYGYPARRWGRWWWVAAGGISVLVAVSRLYLGVHYPKDVLAGLALGVAAVFVCPWLWRRFGGRKLVGWLAIGCLPVVLLLGQADLYKVYGLLVGFWSGIAFEERFVGFSTQIAVWKKALRLLLGLALVGGVQFLLKILFPPFLLCDGLRYALLGFFALGGYPYLFHKAGF